MSGGPFRELFLELGREAFDLAKALGEAAVHEARERVARKGEAAVWRPNRLTSLLCAFEAGPAERYLANRFGWRRFSMVRAATRDEIEIVARLRCGHVYRLPPIEQRRLHAAHYGSLVDTLLASIESRVDLAPRPCFCVPEKT